MEASREELIRTIIITNEVNTRARGTETEISSMSPARYGFDYGGSYRLDGTANEPVVLLCPIYRRAYAD